MSLAIRAKLVEPQSAIGLLRAAQYPADVNKSLVAPNAVNDPVIADAFPKIAPPLLSFEGLDVPNERILLSWLMLRDTCLRILSGNL